MSNKIIIEENFKNYDAIRDFLVQQLGAIIIDADKLDSFRKVDLVNTVKNFEVYLESHTIDCKVSKNDFVVFSLSKSIETERYFINHDSIDNRIYVFIEKKLRFINSHCSELLKDLYLYRGVKQSDIDNETIDYKNYVFFLSNT